MQSTTTTSIHKVRRPDPTRVRIAGGDPSLTGCGGLVAFGTFLRGEGVDRDLARRFTRSKSGPLVVYPMPAQLRLLN